MASDKKNRTFDYKDIEELQVFMTAQGHIHPAKRTGLSGREQRRLKRAIKYARLMSLIPYVP